MASVSAVPDALFDQALNEALASSDVVQALADLERARPEPWRDELIAEIQARREQAATAASEDLKRLSESETNLERALDDAVAAESQRDPQLAGHIQLQRTLINQLERQLEEYRVDIQAAESPKSPRGAETAPLQRKPLPKTWRQRLRLDPPLTEAQERAARAALARQSAPALSQQIVIAEEDLGMSEKPLRDRILADPSRYTALSIALSERDAALTRARRSLVERGILDIARPWLKEKTDSLLRERFSIELTSIEAPGLGELPNRKHEIATGAFQQLGDLLDRLPGGSVGVSGPRGAGKTTLLNQFCQRRHPIKGDEPLLALSVSAPVEYAPLEFVLHLFARACLAVLPANFDEDSLAGTNEAEQALSRIARGFALLCIVIAGATTIAGLAIIAAALSDRTKGAGDHRTYIGIAIAVGSGIAVLAFLLDRFARILRFLPFPRGDAEIYALRGTSVGPFAVVAIAIGALVATAVLLLASDRPKEGVNSTILLGAALLAGVAWLLPVLDRFLRNARWTARTRFERDPHETPASSTGLLTADIASRAVSAAALAVEAIAIALIALAFAGHDVGADLGGGIVIAVVGVIATRFAGLLYASVNRQAAKGREPTSGGQLNPLQDTALDRLQTIRFQQTISSGVSGKVSLSIPRTPLQAEAGIESSRALEERSWTLPEAIDRFRRFIEVAAAQQPALIGIDELDKMSGEAAEKFLNATKAIFGIPNCYFLVSVSEDAVASFERRGLPFRDVFDSAFDEVMHVGYLDLADTERLLAPRVIRIPMQFVALCYCVSAGLPRDIIRVARTLFQLRRETGEQHLGLLAQKLATQEIDSKRRASIVAVRRIEGSAASTGLDWLGRLDTVDPAVTALIPALTSQAALQLPQDVDAKRGVGRMIDELLGYWYFCATLTEVFNDQLIGQRLMDGQQGVAAPKSFERLARARQAFASSPALAWSEIDAFRTAWQLSPVVKPPRLSVAAAQPAGDGAPAAPAGPAKQG